MAMDFFRHQEQARKRTGLLLFYFVLAVVLTALAVNLVFFLVTAWSVQPGLSIGGWLQQPYWGWISLATLGVIGGSSLARYLQLRAGGQVIAEAVGARRIDPDSTVPQERMLLNIVEEMAIASGTPAPTTYVMDAEQGINAFVAGFEPTEAILVVTRGALDNFTRDEMQGVIGHEFSHILNGDMRMNVNLYAILAGILAIGRIGEFLLRSARGGRNNKGSGLPVIVGLALMVIGYVGLFFGRLIKAAISRQRELLADASSVQFTRNPQGIGEALLKIHGHAGGALIGHANAEDMSHMCFALPVQMRLAGLLATHPPLPQRIDAIDPTLLARGRARARMRGNAPADTTPAVTAPAAAAGFAGGALNAAASAPAVASSIGQPTTANLDIANRLHALIPEAVRDALRTPSGARIVIYGLVIAMTDATLEQAALQRVAKADSNGIANRLAALLPELRRLSARLRLPCHDIALPALRAMSDEQKKRFLQLLEELVRIDQRYTVREFITVSLMQKHLAGNAAAARPVRHRSYASVAGALNTVLSLLCHATGSAEAERVALHARVLRGFGTGTPALLPLAGLGAAQLGAALAELAALSPLLKKPLLDACIDCVSIDGKLQVAELELLRAVGDALDCPIPPFSGAA